MVQQNQAQPESGQSDEDSRNGVPVQADDSDSRILIAYFTWTDNTQVENPDDEELYYWYGENKGMERHFRNYKPDTAPKKAVPLPGVLQRHGENTSISRYVWLPIEWEGSKPMIRWYDEWKVEDFR